MSNLSKEILRNYVAEQRFNNIGEVLESLKDVLQEAFEEDLDEGLLKLHR